MEKQLKPIDELITEFGIKGVVEKLTAARERLAGDKFRPLYHFAAPGFGIHDPAGLCRWQDRYHLFYLCTNPENKWERGHAGTEVRT